MRISDWNANVEEEGNINELQALSFWRGTLNEARRLVPVTNGMLGLSPSGTRSPGTLWDLSCPHPHSASAPSLPAT